MSNYSPGGIHPSPDALRDWDTDSLRDYRNDMMALAAGMRRESYSERYCVSHVTDRITLIQSILDAR